MFLRKIVQHLRDQNWTAIGIDLLIVILGVFLGAQASNWNEERQVREGERVFLQRVRTEMAGDLGDAQGKAVYLGEVLAAARRTERFIAAGRPCSGNCWPVLVDFFVASQWQNVAPERGVLDAVRGSIYPYDFDLKRTIIRNYTVIHEGARLFEPSEYRSRVRKLIPAGVQEGLWACNRGFAAFQRVNLACPATIGDAEAGRIVERLRADPALQGELNFNASTVATMTRMTQAWSADTRKLLARVDRKIGKR